MTGGNGRKPSYPEREAISALLKTGCRFIREYEVKPYHFDFAIPLLRLLIEIDSWSYHHKQWQINRDKAKQKLAESQGWKVVRIDAKDDITGRIQSYVARRTDEIFNVTDPQEVPAA